MLVNEFQLVYHEQFRTIEINLHIYYVCLDVNIFPYEFVYIFRCKKKKKKERNHPPRKFKNPRKSEPQFQENQDLRIENVNI